MSLVLSLFPGIGLLDRAFEEEGFCVVRGPDVLWGGDIRRFHPPPGVFGGVIGGPPCQVFSSLANLVHARGHEPSFGNLIPEYERCVDEAAPRWFLMEEVTAAPMPVVDGYAVHTFSYNLRWLGEEQNRLRRFSFGVAGGAPKDLRRWIQQAAFEAPQKMNCVTSGQKRSKGGKLVRYSLSEACRLQGLPEDFLEHAPFTARGKLKIVANAVPLPLGRALARAVEEAIR